jgi:Phage major capsid protein E
MLGSAYDTNTIIEAIQRWVPPAHWLMDNLFPFDRVSDSDLVTLEYYKQGRLLSGFVKPEKRGIARPRKPYQSNTYSPPTVRLTRDLDSAHLAKKRIGRSAFEGGNTDGDILAEDTMELINEIINLHEWLCSQLLFTGSMVIEDYDDRVVLDTITLPGVPQRVTVPPADFWSAAGSASPFRLIKSIQRMITGSMGTSANIICMGSAAADAFEEHPDVKSAYNLLWFRQGMLQPTAQGQEPAVYSLGDFRGIPIYVNEQTYIDRDGNVVPYFPPDTLLVGSTVQMGLMAFAACYQTEPRYLS